MNRKIKNVIKELKARLKQIYGETLYGLCLYGSYANEKENAESDIDIAIILNDFTDYWQEVKRTGPLISSLSLKYDITISPVRIHKENWLKGNSPFLHNLRKESILL